MNRNKKIEVLVDSLKDWDYEVLLSWSQDTMSLILQHLTDEELDKEYKSYVNNSMQ